MRKKLLLEQNIQLFDRLTAAESEIKRLKKELEEEKRRTAARLKRKTRALPKTRARLPHRLKYLNQRL